MAYQQLVELARTCWRQAGITTSKEVADVLRRMAKEYQQKAAQLDSGKVPDIGEEEETPIV